MATRPFSFRWVFLSIAAFVGIELILGGLVGQVLLGRYMSISTKFLLQGALNLVSYFLGGLLIGVVSPGIRISEPAVGAFAAVGLMLMMSFFTPYTFMRFSMPRLFVAGVIACFLAMTGARLGEKIMGNVS